MALGPYKIVAGPLTMSIREIAAAAIGVGCAGANVARSPVRRPFSSTSTSLSPRPLRIGRADAAPLKRVATPGRSDIFSAKLVPALFNSSTRDLDAADWYSLLAVRPTGVAETTTGSSEIGRASCREGV